jgi:sigma-B regulation protein RsbU (phosphoserine phosphatase)
MLRSAQRSLTLHHLPRKAESQSLRVGKTRALVELSREINMLDDDYARLQLVVQKLMAILDARAGLLWDADAEIVHVRHQRHSARIQEFERALREQRAEVTIRYNNPTIQLEDGVMVLPLVWRHRTVGAIALDREGKILTAQEELGVIIIANQLAAIIGLRSRRTRTTEAAPSQAQMDDAAEVQRSLLPPIPPVHISRLAIATHTQPAEFVGGDYFDLILLDKNKMGIVIADVQGKGVPAALFGNLLRSTVNFLTRETPSTAAVMGKINTILHGEFHSPRKLFSMFYAVYDPANKSVTYTGSGHVSPMVVRIADGTIERLCSDGMVIGAQPAQRFTERTLALAQGDVVAFFTDGIIECRNQAQEMFGEERLGDILRARKTETVEQIVDAVLADVSAFSPPPFADDLTLIVTKVL